MPTPTGGAYWSFGGVPLVDPKPLHAECVARRLPAGGWFGLANSYTCPAGEEPGTAHLLIRQRDFDALDPAADYDLVCGEADRTLTVAALTLVRAERVLPAADADADAVLWVQALDRRLHLARKATDRRFNLRDAGGTRLSVTKNGSSDWTWLAAVKALWETDLGLPTLSALPFTPDGVPEGFDFSGGHAWAALHELLRRLACTTVLDPTAGTFSIKRIGEADPAAAAVIAQHLPVRVWDGRAVGLADATDPPRGWRPEKVRVRFRRTPAPTAGDSPVYLVEVATSGGEAGTVVTIDDDEPAIGATGTPSNSAALATRAAERAADWERRRGAGEPPRLAAYRGLRPALVATLGSPGVTAWAVADRGAGAVTELASEPGLEWERPVPPPPGGGYTVVRPTTAGAGDGTFAAAVVQQRNAGTGAWEDTSPTVYVQFRPYWTGMKQKVGPLWRCEDTGQVDTGFSPARAKLEGVIPPRIKRQVQIGCNGSGAPIFANIWVDDVD
jgi:hypothetical protein